MLLSRELKHEEKIISLSEFFGTLYTSVLDKKSSEKAEVLELMENDLNFQSM